MSLFKKKMEDEISYLNDCIEDNMNGFLTDEMLKDISSVLSTDNFRKSVVEPFLEHAYGPKLSSGQARILEIVLNAAQLVYNSGGYSTGMSDTEYDILYEYYLTGYSRKLKNNFPVHQGGKASHKYPTLRGTLDKVYYLIEGGKAESDKNFNRTGLPEWIAKSEKAIEKITGRVINLRDEDIFVFPKFDGESVELNLDENENLLQALTRGDTETNTCDDITSQIAPAYKKPNICAGIEIGLKTEAMMSEENFQKYNEKYRPTDPYKQSRSAIASILHSKNAEDRSEFITLMHLRYSFFEEDGKECLQKLPPGAFNVPYIRCKLGETDAIEDFAQNHKFVIVNGQTYRCDGAVIYIINTDIQRWLGRKDNKQQFEVAYKFTEEIAESVVKDVTFQVGRHGQVTPVLKIKKISMKGNDIKSISLHSMNIFLSKGISKGDKVEVKYDIVPLCGKITSMGKHDPFMAPTHCPICNEKLELSGTELSCNNEHCPSRNKGKILDYLDRMRIKEIGPMVLDDFWDIGILRSIEDLYRLNLHTGKIMGIGGYGPRRIEKILNEIDMHRSCTRATMLGSIGIKSAGIKTFKNILDHISYEELLKRAEEGTSLTSIPGVGENKSNVILDGIEENKNLIKFLELELDLIDEDDISGKTRVCFTSCRPTEKMLDDMEELGAVYDENLTKKTDILVIPVAGVTSSKTKTATKYRKPIVPYDELLSYLREQM